MPQWPKHTYTHTHMAQHVAECLADCGALWCPFDSEEVHSKWHAGSNTLTVRIPNADATLGSAIVAVMHASVPGATMAFKESTGVDAGGAVATQLCMEVHFPDSVQSGVNAQLLLAQVSDTAAALLVGASQGVLGSVMDERAEAPASAEGALKAP